MIKLFTVLTLPSYKVKLIWHTFRRVILNNLNGNIQYLPSAYERCNELFELTDQFIEYLDHLLYSDPISEPETIINVIKLASITRVKNLFVSINLLLRYDHWEEAKILIRSLFELLLNMEEIFRDKATVEKKAQRYLLFNELQEYIKIRAELNYNIMTKRVEDEDKANMAIKLMDQFAEKRFKLFLNNKKGEKFWDHYWTDDKPWKLAKKSKNRIRKQQYDILYADMSHFVHSSPMAVLGTVNSIESVDKRVDEDNKIISEQAILAMTFTQEILLIVGDILPGFTGDKILEMVSKIKLFVHGE